MYQSGLGGGGGLFWLGIYTEGILSYLYAFSSSLYLYLACFQARVWRNLQVHTYEPARLGIDTTTTYMNPLPPL